MMEGIDPAREAAEVTRISIEAERRGWELEDTRVSGRDVLRWVGSRKRSPDFPSVEHALSWMDHWLANGTDKDGV